MSIGPEVKNDENFKITIPQKAIYMIKNFSFFFWQDPIKNIFYFSLISCMVGLILGYNFSFEFYLILGILSVVEAYLFFARQSLTILSEDKPKK